MIFPLISPWVSQVLYIPAGFPHETDTIGAAASGDDADTSVHLTVGVDTHLWGLSYAKARELALSRAGLPTGEGPPHATAM